MTDDSKTNGTRESLARLEERLRAFAEELRNYVTDAKKREEKRHEAELKRAKEEAELLLRVNTIADDVADTRKRLQELEKTGPQSVVPKDPELSKAKAKVYLALAALLTAVAGGVGALVTHLLGGG